MEKYIKCHVLFKWALITGLGNYFHLRPILCLSKCLAGQIQVKYVNIMLKSIIRRPDVARGPYVAPSCFIMSVTSVAVKPSYFIRRTLFLLFLTSSMFILSSSDRRQQGFTTYLGPLKNCRPKFLHKFVCQKQPKTVQPAQPKLAKKRTSNKHIICSYFHWCFCTAKKIYFRQLHCNQIGWWKRSSLFLISSLILVIFRA